MQENLSERPHLTFNCTFEILPKIICLIYRCDFSKPIVFQPILCWFHHVSRREILYVLIIYKEFKWKPSKLIADNWIGINLSACLFHYFEKIFSNPYQRSQGWVLSVLSLKLMKNRKHHNNICNSVVLSLREFPLVYDNNKIFTKEVWIKILHSCFRGWFIEVGAPWIVRGKTKSINKEKIYFIGRKHEFRLNLHWLWIMPKLRYINWVPTILTLLNRTLITKRDWWSERMYNKYIIARFL